MPLNRNERFRQTRKARTVGTLSATEKSSLQVYLQVPPPAVFDQISPAASQEAVDALITLVSSDAADTLVSGVSPTAAAALTDAAGLTSTSVLFTDASTVSTLSTAATIDDAFAENRGLIDANTSAIAGILPAATAWSTATGTVSRATYASFSAQTISTDPTQTEVQNIDDHITILSQTVAALIGDLKTAGILST